MADHHTTRVDALASLAVEVGANVADRQTVVIVADLADASLVRAIARSAYRRGADHVDVHWNDSLVRKIRLQEAADAALGQVPQWKHELPTELGAIHGALISLVGDPAPGLFDDIDPQRLGRDAAVIPEWGQVVGERTVNWGVIPSPTPGWAAAVHPGLDPDAALERCGRRSNGSAGSTRLIRVPRGARAAPSSRPRPSA